MEISKDKGKEDLYEIGILKIRDYDILLSFKELLFYSE